jgi:hypothetical protein
LETVDNKSSVFPETRNDESVLDNPYLLFSDEENRAITTGATIDDLPVNFGNFDSLDKYTIPSGDAHSLGLQAAFANSNRSHLDQDVIDRYSRILPFPKEWNSLLSSTANDVPTTLFTANNPVSLPTQPINEIDPTQSTNQFNSTQPTNQFNSTQPTNQFNSTQQRLTTNKDLEQLPLPHIAHSTEIPNEIWDPMQGYVVKPSPRLEMVLEFVVRTRDERLESLPPQQVNFLDGVDAWLLLLNVIFYPHQYNGLRSFLWNLALQRMNMEKTRRTNDIPFSAFDMSTWCVEAMKRYSKIFAIDTWAFRYAQKMYEEIAKPWTKDSNAFRKFKEGLTTTSLQSIGILTKGNDFPKSMYEATETTPEEPVPDISLVNDCLSLINFILKEMERNKAPKSKPTNLSFDAHQQLPNQRGLGHLFDRVLQDKGYVAEFEGKVLFGILASNTDMSEDSIYFARSFSRNFIRSLMKETEQTRIYFETFRILAYAAQQNEPFSQVAERYKPPAKTPIRKRKRMAPL